MVRMRNLVKVGNREVKKRYVGNKLIFEDLSDKTEVLSGTEIFTDKADDSAVHVEIDGKSYQDGEPTPDYPKKIHSLNDFDVVSSVGKRNLLSNTDNIKQYSNIWDMWPIEEEVFGLHRRLRRIPGENNILSNYTNAFYNTEIGKKYTQSIEVNPEKTVTLKHYYGADIICPAGQWTTLYGIRTATSDRHRYFGISGSNVFDENGNGIWIQYRNEKVEEGNINTAYAPAPENILESDNHPLIDKINLSLDEPLRSVGDVKDRLFRDSDGLWKVERNVGEFVVDGSEDIETRAHGNGTQSYTIIIGASNILYIDSNTNMTQSSHYVGRSWRDLYHGQDGIAAVSSNVRVKDDRFSYDINLFKAWLSEQHAGGNPLTVQYHIEPTVEVLDQELQSKLNNLRSFEDSNYVYTIVNDKTDTLSDYIADNLKPTLHTTFKSKGWYDYYQKTLLK